MLGSHNYIVSGNSSQIHSLFLLLASQHKPNSSTDNTKLLRTVVTTGSLHLTHTHARMHVRPVTRTRRTIDFNARLPLIPEEVLKGIKIPGGWRIGNGIPSITCSVANRMTPGLRWAAITTILMFKCEGQSRKTVSTDHEC